MILVMFKKNQEKNFTDFEELLIARALMLLIKVKSLSVYSVEIKKHKNQSIELNSSLHHTDSSKSFCA